ncbi:MAG: hypothetical protein HC889_10655, partial [Synechococcaceae cyanobacterium SM1_2_3]|nr:hypothetical protein [Synechococcaceae cyanobacterium SM1_2_3]
MVQFLIDFLTRIIRPIQQQDKTALQAYSTFLLATRYSLLATRYSPLDHSPLATYAA